MMHSNDAIGAVIAIPAIDHGWTEGNTNEFREPFEFNIYGCTTSSFSASNCELGHITKVWTKSVDDLGPSKNADDWTTQWNFQRRYNFFAITAGDTLLNQGSPFSPGEGEIDALAVAVPEPETYAARRQKPGR